MAKQRWLFTEEEEDREVASREVGEDQSCTPEKLLAFCRSCEALTGKPPSLRDLKSRFGGLLGPLVCAWSLEDQGLLRNGKVVKSS